MNLLLLPGNSPKNKDWIESIAEECKPDFNKTVVVNYYHWNEDGGFKTVRERERLIELLTNGDDWSMFAKSMGISFLIDCVKKELISPEYCFFCGTTSKSARMLTDFHLPTLLIQESMDPFLSFSELETIVSHLGYDNYDLEEVPGSKHRYENVGEIGKLMNKFLDKYKVKGKV